MGIEKDFSRIKQNLKEVRFSELEKIILREGFKRVIIRGSHCVYKKGRKILTVVKPRTGHKQLRTLTSPTINVILCMTI